MVRELMAPINCVLGEERAAEEGDGCHCYAASPGPFAGRVTSQQIGNGEDLGEWE